MSLWDGGTHGMDFRDQSRNADLCGMKVTSPHMTQESAVRVLGTDSGRAQYANG